LFQTVIISLSDAPSVGDDKPEASCSVI